VRDVISAKTSVLTATFGLTLSMLLLGICGISSQAQAGSAETASVQVVLAPYGQTTVSELPAAQPLTGTVRGMPRKFPNPAALQLLKQALAGQEGPAAPKPQKANNGHKKHPTPTPTATPAATPTATPTTTGPTPTPTATPTPVSAASSFQGLQFTDTAGYCPPDTQVAAGPEYLLEMVNLTGRIYDKTGNTKQTFSLYNFFDVSTSDGLTDPRVVYDPDSGRWFAVTATYSPSSAAGWNLAVSDGDDPTGTWQLYAIPTVGNYPDFPKIGVNSDKVVLTGDAFSGNTYLGTEFVVLSKANLLTGSAVYNFYSAPQGLYAIEPAIHLAATTGGTSNSPDDFFMAAVTDTSASSVRVWTITGDPASGNTDVVTHDVPISLLATPPNAAQPGTHKTIVTNDNALLDAVFRDGSPYGSLWVSANDACTPPGDGTIRSCLRLIDVPIGQSTDLVEDGVPGAAPAYDFDVSAAGMYYYYPAIRTDNSGKLVSAFSGSSSTQYASVYTLTFDPENDNPDTIAASLVHAGNAAYRQCSRWGDYSGTGLDPVSGVVWGAGEYATATCRFSVCSEWGTWIAGVTP
jgi:hypothetical protein